ncbi:uncharacterized protein LOC123263476 isoform X1 [Cotesia glomerata]|uniref:uncharacterized protein LOC123263476 isoform X1 n=1 Tax=Cotesia glomerata TaxID=32391 RepID=UPI001D00F32F|nr:uncharacterized protein LOC123263476 isoform X1 [Cotesia glomerata]XP_044582199.1 uncharacterized protein LOC123263476 isoform X1 [Cotesia glomerata]XP_044582200.1 uncharacterized protein LOC123263476 isoform X1 [Cotesia glomerata]XP_044582201.1 uncharacterized protein LOC123263476 isoform X1 [Cotesia glomerata]XP_044582202.1 uncharacterized protein LOC123263476 isoform X1 [Cotesia glomerata]
MKKTNAEESKKSDKVYVSKQLTTADRCQDLVSSDNTSKELICIEKKAEKNWKRFDHLSGENVKRLVEEYLGESKVRELKDKLLPVNKSFERNLIPPGAVNPSPAIPRTSSATVGWRSSLPEHNLEVFGRLHISPKNTIITSLPEHFTHQKFIILG